MGTGGPSIFEERNNVIGGIATCVVLFLMILAILVSKKIGRHKDKIDVSFYAIPAKITTIDESRERVGATDSRGIEWYWYGESDAKLRDMVILVMNNNGTEYIFDDVVENVSVAEMAIN